MLGIGKTERGVKCSFLKLKNLFVCFVLIRQLCLIEGSVLSYKSHSYSPTMLCVDWWEVQFESCIPRCKHNSPHLIASVNFNPPVFGSGVVLWVLNQNYHSGLFFGRALVMTFWWLAVWYPLLCATCECIPNLQLKTTKGASLWIHLDYSVVRKSLCASVEVYSIKAIT